MVAVIQDKDGVDRNHSLELSSLDLGNEETLALWSELNSLVILG